MNQVLSTNGSFTIIDESRSTVLSGIITSKVLKLLKFWVKSSVVGGIVRSKVFETSQVLLKTSSKFWKVVKGLYDF